MIRADESGSSIEIEEGCNAQDLVIIHALGETSVIIGRSTSLSDACVLHGRCGSGERVALWG